MTVSFRAFLLGRALIPEGAWISRAMRERLMSRMRRGGLDPRLRGDDVVGGAGELIIRRLRPSPPYRPCNQKRHPREGGDPSILQQPATLSIRPTMPKQPCVYILASDRNGTLYIGVTSGIYDRVAIHKQELLAGFTKKYGVQRLVYYEMHEDMKRAIGREKQLKKWNRLWKIRLIEQINPEWADLMDEAVGLLDAGNGGQIRND